jgi:hypothetical protein
MRLAGTQGVHCRRHGKRRRGGSSLVAPAPDRVGRPEAQQASSAAQAEPSKDMFEQIVLFMKVSRP